MDILLWHLYQGTDPGRGKAQFEPSTMHRIKACTEAGFELGGGVHGVFGT